MGGVREQIEAVPSGIGTSLTEEALEELLNEVAQ